MRFVHHPRAASNLCRQGVSSWASIGLAIMRVKPRPSPRRFETVRNGSGTECNDTHPIRAIDGDDRPIDDPGIVALLQDSSIFAVGVAVKRVLGEINHREPLISAETFAEVAAHVEGTRVLGPSL